MNVSIKEFVEQFKNRWKGAQSTPATLAVLQSELNTFLMDSHIRGIPIELHCDRCAISEEYSYGTHRFSLVFWPDARAVILVCNVCANLIKNGRII